MEREPTPLHLGHKKGRMLRVHTSDVCEWPKCEEVNSKLRFRRGLCRKHYTQFMKEHNKGLVCAVPHCKNTGPLTKNLCRKHYMKKRAAEAYANRKLTTDEFVADRESQYEQINDVKERLEEADCLIWFRGVEVRSIEERRWVTSGEVGTDTEDGGEVPGAGTPDVGTDD